MITVQLFLRPERSEIGYFNRRSNLNAVFQNQCVGTLYTTRNNARNTIINQRKITQVIVPDDIYFIANEPVHSYVSLNKPTVEINVLMDEKENCTTIATKEKTKNLLFNATSPSTSSINNDNNDTPYLNRIQSQKIPPSPTSTHPSSSTTTTATTATTTLTPTKYSCKVYTLFDRIIRLTNYTTYPSSTVSNQAIPPNSPDDHEYELIDFPDNVNDETTDKEKSVENKNEKTTHQDKTLEEIEHISILINQTIEHKLTSSIASISKYFYAELCDHKKRVRYVTHNFNKVIHLHIGQTLCFRRRLQRIPIQLSFCGVEYLKWTDPSNENTNSVQKPMKKYVNVSMVQQFDEKGYIKQVNQNYNLQLKPNQYELLLCGYIRQHSNFSPLVLRSRSPISTNVLLARSNGRAQHIHKRVYNAQDEILVLPWNKLPAMMLRFVGSRETNDKTQLTLPPVSSSPSTATRPSSLAQQTKENQNVVPFLKSQNSSVLSHLLTHQYWPRFRICAEIQNYLEFVSDMFTLIDKTIKMEHWHDFNSTIMQHQILHTQIHQVFNVSTSNFAVKRIDPILLHILTYGQGADVYDKTKEKTMLKLIDERIQNLVSLNPVVKKVVTSTKSLTLKIATIGVYVAVTLANNLGNTEAQRLLAQANAQLWTSVNYNNYLSYLRIIGGHVSCDNIPEEIYSLILVRTKPNQLLAIPYEIKRNRFPDTVPWISDKKLHSIVLQPKFVHQNIEQYCRSNTSSNTSSNTDKNKHTINNSSINSEKITINHNQELTISSSIVQPNIIFSKKSHYNEWHNPTLKRKILSIQGITFDVRKLYNTIEKLPITLQAVNITTPTVDKSNVQVKTLAFRNKTFNENVYTVNNENLTDLFIKKIPNSLDIFVNEFLSHRDHEMIDKAVTTPSTAVKKNSLCTLQFHFDNNDDGANNDTSDKNHTAVAANDWTTVETRRSLKRTTVAVVNNNSNDITHNQTHNRTREEIEKSQNLLVKKNNPQRRQRTQQQREQTGQQQKQQQPHSKQSRNDKRQQRTLQQNEGTNRNTTTTSTTPKTGQNQQNQQNYNRKRKNRQGNQNNVTATNDNTVNNKTIF